MNRNRLRAKEKLIFIVLLMVIASSFTLVGCWRKVHTVEFNSLGGTLVANQSIKDSEKVTEPKSPEKAGYIFEGWFKDAAGTEQWVFSQHTVTKNTILFAKWRLDNLAMAQINKVAEITELLRNYKQEDYASDKWQQLQAIVTDAIADVNLLTAVADVEATSVKAIQTECDNVHRAITRVSTKEQLVAALEISDKVILMADIQHIGDYDYNEHRINILAIERDYDVEIDLNGFTLGYLINIRNRDKVDGKTQYFKSADVTISDSSAEKTGVVGSLSFSNLMYGVQVLGDKNVKITLTDITLQGYYGGFASNGTDKSATITATGCYFEGVSEDGVGAYLPAGHTYIFTNCTFKGASGIHVKSGNLKLTNCQIYAHGEYKAPEYNGNGANITGNGLMIEPTKGYHAGITVEVEGGKIESENGYAVKEAAFIADGAGVDATATIKDCQLTGEKGTYKSENNVITILDDNE